jgi:hypothetical protein
MCSIDDIQVTSSTSTREEVRCGYRPRSILVLDAEGRVLVGAQDGSVTEVKLKDAISLKNFEKGLRSIEVLYDDGKDRLLIGDRVGQVWRMPKSLDQSPELFLSTPTQNDITPGAGACGPVTCIDNLGSDLLVSWRASPVRVLKTSKGVADLADQPSCTVDIYGVIKLLSLRSGGRFRYMAVSSSGKLWWIKNNDQGDWAENPIAWKSYGLEEPGMVWSVAEAKSQTETEKTLDKGVEFAVYLATDTGVYLLSGPPQDIDARGLTITRLLLPGITGICTAIAYPSLKSESYRYLWAADSTGQVHLFRSDRRDRTKTSLINPLWQRIHLQRYDARVVKAAVHRHGDTFQVVQARTNDTIMVTIYQQIAKKEARSSVRLCEWLWWGRIESPPPELDELLAGTEEWHLEARVAEIIELAGERWPGELGEFLSNPRCDLAYSVLASFKCSASRSSAEGSSPPDQARVVNAIYLWAFALLGTISRRLSPDQHEQACLGAIRWLQQIEQKMIGEQTGPLTPWQRSLSGAVDGAIDYIRLWGVLGPQFTRRSEPLCQLAELSKPESGGSDLENLILDGLMFQRQLDIESTRPASQGRYGESSTTTRIRVEAPIALDLRHLRLTDIEEEWLAVSWRTGIVDLYSVRQRDPVNGPYRGYELGDPTPVELPPAKEELIEGPVSRNIVLSRLNGRYYILEAPARKRTTDKEDQAQLRIRVLSEKRKPSQPFSITDNKKGEGIVHTMLEVAPGQILVGLVGSRVEPRCLLVRVDLKREPKLSIYKRFGLVEDRTEGRSTDGQGPNDDDSLRRAAKDQDETSVLSNGVSVLTRIPDNDEDKRISVLAGCFDGQVWKIELELERSQSEPEKLVRSAVSKVGRLGSAVSALGCSQGEHERVFAGSSDGTLLAWQRVKSGYASLWAVHESSPIISIDAFTSRPGRGSQSEPGVANESLPLVVAVTRGGRALIFDDRPGFSRPEGSASKKPSHHRLIGPGSRMAAIDLGSRCYSSVLIGCEQEAIGMVARLGIAGSRGLQLVSLYFPERTELRKRKFEEILKLWQRYIGWSDKAEDSDLLPEIQVFMRHTETAYAADAFLPRMMIGWLFAKGESQSRHQLYSKLPEPVEQWFPRLLRPMVALDRDWESPEADHGGLLKEALERAEQAGDFALFREILTVVLRRSNHHFFELAAEEREVFAEKYQGILETIGRVCERCIGKSPEIDLAVHRVLAKELPDGDLLWRIFIDGPNPEDGTSTSDVLSNRLALIKGWLDHDNPEVALDTLRASNLVLLTACLRLERKQGLWPRDVETSEIPWKPVRISSDIAMSFTERLDYSARGATSDAVSHEIGRAYSLFILACPSAIARLPRWIYETNLPRRSLRHVNRQLEFLTDLLPEVQVPENAREFLDVLMEPLAKEEDVDIRYLSKYRDFTEATRYGEPNARLSEQMGIYDEIVVWFDELRRNLKEHPGAVDLKSRPRSYDHLKKIGIEKPEEYPFEHSSNFWNRVFDSLDEQLQGVGVPGKGPVRPEVALLSRELADWCMRQRQELRQLRKSRLIFTPMYQIYDRVLEQLESAARSFRESAAVQKDIVVSVLDHGLLARLDEHLLELWEVAQVLDPLKSWNGESSQGSIESGNKTMPTAARFASHLLDRARSAECIPKNLRTLRGLLGSESGPDSGEIALGDLVTEFARRNGWKQTSECVDGDQLTGHEAYYLQLCLDELAHNHREHGSQKTGPTIARDSCCKGSTRLTVCCRFHEGDRAEIDSVLGSSGGLQKLVSVDDSTEVPKHGSGLYLANLAAATAGWKLEYRLLQPDQLVFSLTKVDRRPS